MKIQLLPSLKDNYIFIVVDQERKEAVVIDPSEGTQVIEYLKNHGLRLKFILNTHHHGDHVGGNVELQNYFSNIKIYASEYDHNNQRIPGQSHVLTHGEIIFFHETKIFVYETPGHTLGHLCYHFIFKNGEHHLFVGDTLFSGGCGRLFEGSFEQMYTSLKFIKENVPHHTLIWCAHEYTLQNYLILQNIFPQDRGIQTKLENIYKLIKLGLPTIPFTLQSELESSLFLRFDDPKLQAHFQTCSELNTFVALRKYRDHPPKVQIDI